MKNVEVNFIPSSTNVKIAVIVDNQVTLMVSQESSIDEVAAIKKHLEEME